MKPHERAWNGFLTKCARFWEVSGYWYHLLRPARACVIVAALVPILFIFVDQGKDILRRLATEPGHKGARLEVTCMLLGLFVLGMTSWAWARFLLNCAFAGTDERVDITPRAESVRKFTRRFCGLVPAISMAAGFIILSLDSPGKRPLYWLLSGLCLVTAFVLWVGFEKQNARLRIHKKYETLSEVRSDKEAWSAICLSIGFWAVLSLAFAFFPISLGELIGSAGVLLFALAAWICLGSLLIYWGGRYHVPVITLLLLMAGVFSIWNDNHQIRVLSGAPATGQNLDKALESWYFNATNRYSLATGTTNHPMFLVAAAGGGIRAAYWTAVVLAELEDQARKQDRSFLEHAFALSGVSGGSLGEVTFVSLAVHKPESEGFHPLARRLLNKDFLAADLARMAYGDFFQRFFPLPLPWFDRARALEDSWSMAWPNRELDESIGELYDAAKAKNISLPHLLLNGTSVETGRRIITSDLKIRTRSWTEDKLNDGDFLDVIAASDRLDDKPIRLSTAAHLSARFTYFSPPGRFPDSERSRVVDGGYFENSGATTLMDLLAVVRRRIYANKWRIEPKLIVIDNDPIRVGSKPHAHPHVFAEALTPIFALYDTRGARGSYAQQQALDYNRLPPGNTNTTLPAKVFEFYLFSTNINPSLGWTLCTDSILSMDYQLTNRLATTIARIVNVLPSRKP